jgi:hypothetical protein
MFNQLVRRTYPFIHFISEGHSLPSAVASDMLLLAKPGELKNTRGSRADYKERVFFKSGSYTTYSAPIRLFLDELCSESFAKDAMKHFNVDLKGSSLRIELACDVDGFFQIPHTDVGDKRITWLTYLGTQDENNDVGTDLYEDLNTPACSAPWGYNNGLIFKPGPTTFHGFTKGKKIKGDRKVLIINFVDNWKDKHELYA